LNKIRPSANVKDDEFLPIVIGPNVPALEAVTHVVFSASG
jgi:hypothetical protein